jgi:hypothetical protein
MIYIKQLSKCLEEWNFEVGEKRITDFNGLISSLTIQLGYVDFQSAEFKTNPVQSLEKLLIKLTESTTVFEEILVDGILFNIQSSLNRNVLNREKVIKYNEFLLENADKLSIRDVKEMVVATLDKLKAPDYIDLAEKEIEIWNKVYDKYFSPEVREELFNEKSKTMSKVFQGNMSDDERLEYEEIKAKLRN